MLCFRILYLNRILKQKKTYYVEEEEKEEIPNRKMKMKTTKKMKRKLYIDYYIIIRIIARESLPYIILFVKHQTFMETDEIVYE